MTVLLALLVWVLLSISAALAMAAFMRVGQGPTPVTTEAPGDLSAPEALPAPEDGALAA